MSSSSQILVGTAGWSYEDWAGIFYPLGMQRRREHPLTYLAQSFDLAEINASFHGHIKPEWAKIWAKRVDAVNPQFRFTAKLYQSFTHASKNMPGPTSAASINPTREDERLVREGLGSLTSTGKLSAILAQFPLSYKNTPLNREYLEELAARFSDLPIAIEVRDESWDAPDTIRFFAQLKLAFCNIDFLPGGAGLEGTEYVTAPMAYVRLHGRQARHDYLYNHVELGAWAEKIKRMAQKARVVYVIANNPPAAKAVVNALQLQYILTGRQVTAPHSLVKRYPELRSIAAPYLEDAGSLPFPA